MNRNPNVCIVEDRRVVGLYVNPNSQPKVTSGSGGIENIAQIVTDTEKSCIRSSLSVGVCYRERTEPNDVNSVPNSCTSSQNNSGTVSGSVVSPGNKLHTVQVDIDKTNVIGSSKGSLARGCSVDKSLCSTIDRRTCIHPSSTVVNTHKPSSAVEVQSTSDESITIVVYRGFRRLGTEVTVIKRVERCSSSSRRVSSIGGTGRSSRGTRSSLSCRSCSSSSRSSSINRTTDKTINITFPCQVVSRHRISSCGNFIRTKSDIARHGAARKAQLSGICGINISLGGSILVRCGVPKTSDLVGAHSDSTSHRAASQRQLCSNLVCYCRSKVGVITQSSSKLIQGIQSTRSSVNQVADGGINVGLSGSIRTVHRCRQTSNSTSTPTVHVEGAVDCHIIERARARRSSNIARQVSCYVTRYVACEVTCDIACNAASDIPRKPGSSGDDGACDSLCRGSTNDRTVNRTTINVCRTKGRQASDIQSTSDRSILVNGQGVDLCSTINEQVLELKGRGAKVNIVVSNRDDNTILNTKLLYRGATDFNKDTDPIVDSIYDDIVLAVSICDQGDITTLCCTTIVSVARSKQEGIPQCVKLCVKRCCFDHCVSNDISNGLSRIACHLSLISKTVDNNQTLNAV